MAILLFIIKVNGSIETWFSEWAIGKNTENLTCDSSFCNIAGCKAPTWMKI